MKEVYVLYSCNADNENYIFHGIFLNKDIAYYNAAKMNENCDKCGCDPVSVEKCIVNDDTLEGDTSTIYCRCNFYIEDILKECYSIEKFVINPIFKSDLIISLNYNKKLDEVHGILDIPYTDSFNDDSDIIAEVIKKVREIILKEE